jgi:IclR family acetate operon transcriptional repressor
MEISTQSVEERSESVPKRAKVPAVAAAIAILKYLETQDRVPCGLTRIAQQVGLYKSTCYDILQALEAEGFVVREPATRGYLLGSALVGLGAKAVADPVYVQIALQHLIVVSKQVQASCGVVQRLGEDEIQIVGQIDGPANPHLHVDVGQRFPLALGRATAMPFLTWGSETERRSLFERFGDQDLFADFGHDWDRFEAHIAQVRAQGYATLRGFQSNLGTDAFAIVAAPIFDRAGRVALVANVAPLGYRAAPERLPAYGPCLMEATGRITRAIGGQFPADYPKE